MAAFIERRADHSTPLSVIIEGGASDDLMHGSGFAHLREHWALASLNVTLSPRVRYCTARTLHHQTEFFFELRGTLTDCPVSLEWLPLTDTLLDREREVVKSEIRLAEADSRAMAIDRVLPRLLNAYGVGTDWGFGDLATLNAHSVSSMTSSVHHTWRTPRVHVQLGGAAASADRPREMNSSSVRVAGRSGRAPTATVCTIRSCYVGWRVTVDEPRGFRDLEDLRHFLVRVVVPRLPQDSGTRAKVAVRSGQFSELYTARTSDYFTIALETDGPRSPAFFSSELTNLLRSAREILTTAVQRGDGASLGQALDNIRLVYEAKGAQHPSQRVLLANRAAAAGLQCHPHLEQTVRTAAENTCLVGRLLCLVESLECTDGARVAVTEAGDIVY